MNKRLPIQLAVGIILIFALIIGGYFYFINKNKYRIADNQVQTENCNFKQECSSEDDVECFKEALAKSGCFSRDYIDKHFKNFKKIGGTSYASDLQFDYFVEGQELCHSYCEATVQIFTKEQISKYPSGTFEGSEVGLISYKGPQSETLAITKSQAAEMLKKKSKCEDFKGDPHLMLIIRDSKGGGDDPYNKKGLYWMISAGSGNGDNLNSCGRSCWVNTMTGELTVGEYNCV